MAIMMTHYFVIAKGGLDIEALYTSDKKGTYCQSRRFLLVLVSHADVSITYRLHIRSQFESCRRLLRWSRRQFRRRKFSAFPVIKSELIL